MAELGVLVSVLAADDQGERKFGEAMVPAAPRFGDDAE
jgi:hypothetical protein